MRSFALLLLLAFAQAAHGQSSLLIEVHAPGYASQTVEKTVLAPVEQQLLGMKPVRRLRGLALDGRCLLHLELAKKADPELVRLLVQNRIALAKTKLPPSCAIEVLPQVDDAFMLITVEPAAKMTLAEATQLVNKTIWPELANAAGVAHIQVVGATEQQFRIALDPKKLKKYGLSASEAVAAVQDSLKNVDDLIVMGKRVTVKQTETVRELGEIPMKVGENLYIRDIASVKLLDESREDARISLRTGKELSTRRAVFVLVHLSPGKLNLLAKKELEKTLGKLRGKLPEGVLCEGQLLQADNTTVVMRLPNTVDMSRRAEQAQDAAKAMLELPQVRKVFSLVQPGDNEAVFWLMTDPGEKVDLHKSLRAKLARIKDTSSRVGGLKSPLFPWPSEGSQLVVRLPNERLAELLCKRLRNTAGIVDVDLFPRMGKLAIVEIDREKAGLSGLTTRGIIRDLTAHADKVELPLLRRPWRLTVEVPKDHDNTPKQTIEDLEKLVFSTVNPLVNLMLSDVATVRLIDAPGGGIPHEDGRSCVIISANLEGRTLEEARTDIRRIIQDLGDKGVGIEIEGTK
ncbi:MAG TPA: efflux RND transporter permease subunit [Gemmataceae bacterium]|jgi:multidrug efflux pump subunit AcrB